MIKFNDINTQWIEIKNSVPIDQFLSSGPYILGENVRQFEKEFSEYCGARYAVGVSNGTNALKLAIQVLMPLHSDTEVIIPANCHVSSALAPAYFKCKTVVIDCDENHLLDIDKLIDHLSKCEKHHLIIVTHMYGLVADVQRIKAIDRDIMIIEDCSHAHGAVTKGQHVGTVGTIGLFSLYPTKLLGSCGDGGIIITNNSAFDDCLRALRNYGEHDKNDCQDIGWNNRLDEIQALILREKLKHLDKWNEKRNHIAKLYNDYLKNIGDLILPSLTEGRVFHIYQIRTTQRDQLQAYLKKRDIPTLIHYPRTIYQTEQFHHLYTEAPRAEKYAQEILSLPIHPYLTDKEIGIICAAIEDFFSEYLPEETRLA